MIYEWFPNMNTVRFLIAATLLFFVLGGFQGTFEKFGEIKGTFKIQGIFREHLGNI
jgi:hypothetical protein